MLRLRITFIVAMLAVVGIVRTVNSQDGNAASTPNNPPTPVATPSGASDLPIVLLQEQFKTLTSEVSDLEKNRKKLQDFRNKVDNARKKLQGVSYDQAQAAKLLTKLDSLLSPPTKSGLGGSPVKSLAITRSIAIAISDIAGQMQDIVESPQKAMQPLSGFVSTRPYDSPSSTNPAIMEILQSVGSLSFEEINSIPTDLLYLRSESANPIKPEDLQSSLQKLQNGGLKRLYEKRYLDVQEYLNNLSQAANSKADELENELKSKSIELRNLGTQIEQKQASTEWAGDSIRALLWVLGALFASLLLFPQRVVIEIIRERLLIELLSMAFLLLTIIVLSVGGALKAEALGTLLGTIAGYLLGRRTSEIAASAANRAREESSLGSSNASQISNSSDDKSPIVSSLEKAWDDLIKKIKEQTTPTTPVKTDTPASSSLPINYWES